MKLLTGLQQPPLICNKSSLVVHNTVATPLTPHQLVILAPLTLQQQQAVTGGSRCSGGRVAVDRT